MSTLSSANQDDDAATNQTADNLVNNNSSSKLGHTDDCIKPFHLIPGPWPSLPLIGTLWQHYFHTLSKYCFFLYFCINL